MSMYQYAMQQGATALVEAAVGSSAAYDSAYQASYSSAISKLNAREQKHTIALNISAVEQDKVLTNTKINQQKAQAKASAVVSAAAAGVEGGSVDDVMYDADRSAAMAKSASIQQAEQEKESLFSQMSSLNEAQFNIADTTDNTLVNSLVGLVGSVDSTDLERWGLSLDEGTGGEG